MKKIVGINSKRPVFLMGDRDRGLVSMFTTRLKYPLELDEIAILEGGHTIIHRKT